MSHSRRNGFTLVELLVVITIIGMLMALLLPAVGAATENARSLKCKNRVKQVATAMASYESRFESFPGYTNAVEIKGSQDRHMPWLVAIMGDMERQDVLDQWKREDLSDGELPRPFLDFLTCPSDPPLGNAKAWTSYVGNVGNSKHDLAGCGLMHTKYPFRQKNGKKMAHTTSSLDKLAAGDGASMTIMVTENIQASQWDEPAYMNTQRPNALRASVKAGVPTNVFVWHDASTVDESWTINGGNYPPNARPSSDNARPSSEHKGGVNVAFADGHVVFMKKDVDYTVYTRLMSSDGKKCGLEFQKNNNKAPKVSHAVPLSDADYK